MRIHPHCDPTGRTLYFEIDNVYAGPATVARLLARVEGVSGVRKRRLFGRWEDIHVWFHYRNEACIVLEPFGDNSRYWIGPQGAPGTVDLSEIARAFASHEPPVHRRVLGDLVTLYFLKRWLGRDDDWRRIPPAEP